MTRQRGALLAGALLCCLSAVSQAAKPIDLSRLTEKQIELTPKNEGAWRKTYGLGVQDSGSAEPVPPVDPPRRISGYFALDGVTKAAKMFYFFFQARINPQDAPVVLWMTGGPGCSSELAVLYENGPYTFDKFGSFLVETEYGWDVTHNMIFVDQPIGTGFSYTDNSADTVYDEKGVAEDMLDFLHHFFAAHPDLADRPFFITGESYAGHYVPAVSYHVWQSNKNKEGAYINFQGLAVGNGLTEPSIQYDAYGDFAVQAGLIGQTTRSWMKFLYPLCRLGNQWCESTNWGWVCSLGNTYCQVTQFEPIMDANPNVNVYDYTKKCDGRLCYDFTAADKYLNLPSTRKALGVPDKLRWQSCNFEVYGNFAGDWLHRYDTVLPDMLAEGIKVMIYAGDLDIICNYLGNRRWVDALDWYGTEGWDDETDREWQVAGQPAGKVKRWGPLAFVQVYKAGHMVPMDQPLHALAMITSWTRNHTIDDVMGAHRLTHTHTDTAATHTALRTSAVHATMRTHANGGAAVMDSNNPEYSVAELFRRLVVEAKTGEEEGEDKCASVAKQGEGTKGKGTKKCTGKRGGKSGSVSATAHRVASCAGVHAANFVSGLSRAAAKVHAAMQRATRKLIVSRM